MGRGHHVFTIRMVSVHLVHFGFRQVVDWIGWFLSLGLSWAGISKSPFSWWFLIAAIDSVEKWVAEERLC